ncbi:MAG TPA: radical SAM protein [Bryobacteraceae bacterium]|nr:radical SAM protein [Bryobacteraceae bacterium]
MGPSHLVRAWSKILKGQRPTLSIEITSKCPLHCPGCYAYDESHLGDGVMLNTIRDYTGDDLVHGVLDLVDRLRPLHLSIVGGDPLVRYRELELLMPRLLARGIHVQVVTSAFRPLPESWKGLSRLNVSVSIDGLREEHDVRRAPATYDRILKNISGHRITVHCTITAPMMQRAGYLREFLEFWTPRPEIARVWFSLFTPQVGDERPEILEPQERRRAIAELRALGRVFPKLDMADALIRQFASPPKNPADCVFAQTTETVSADLKTRIGPCQFGGNPDCAACGCMASMGLAAIADHRLGGVLPVGAIFRASLALGRMLADPVAVAPASPANELRVLQ